MSSFPLPQESLIARVRDLCLQDGRLAAALMYGSFTTDQADAHSDIEFWLFATSPVDERRWLADIGPILHTVVNEFGAHVALFPGLIRGEFHFTTADDIPTVAGWPARGAPTDRMLILDRTGALRRALDSLPLMPPIPTSSDMICGHFVNWLVLAHHVAQRGELARAADALSHARRHLLWMARLAEGRTEHWLTPSRNAENELPGEVVGAETPAAIWRCGRRYWTRLADGPLPADLVRELDAAFGY